MVSKCVLAGPGLILARALLAACTAVIQLPPALPLPPPPPFHHHHHHHLHRPSPPRIPPEFAAPTNAAFAALPAYVVTFLTAPENAGLLAAVLTYHVSPSKVTTYTPNQKIPSVQGSNFFVEFIDGACVNSCSPFCSGAGWVVHADCSPVPCQAGPMCVCRRRV
jgi:hypothetical protein